MKKLLALLFLFLQTTLFSQTPVINYPVDSASVEHAGVPKGEIIKLTFSNSKIFPGTFREYSVYVPAQYKPDQPACVYVNQDGIQWKAPTVFDNLIYQKEMPVTIGVFVTPGAWWPLIPKQALTVSTGVLNMMDWVMPMRVLSSMKFCRK
jgi:gluconolactonase